jgi:hypothetical protein
LADQRKRKNEVEKMPELKEGEKYLTITLFGGEIKLSAFPNKDRDGNQPHFIGNGVSVWVNKKKPKTPEVEEII